MGNSVLVSEHARALDVTSSSRSVRALLVTAIVLLAMVSLLALPSPASSQGIAPTATIVPEEVEPPPPTPVSVPASDGSKGDDGEEQVKGLFFDIEGEPPPSPGVESDVSRFANIDFAQLDPSLASVSRPLGTGEVRRLAPRTVTLNLFEDAVFTGRIEHVEPTASGYAFWGDLDDVELGTMTMVVNGDVVVGTVRTPQAVYTITTTSTGSYVIRQIDESDLPPLAEPLEAPPDSDEGSQQALDVSISDDDGSLIDVMVFYTPAAKILMGGRAGIEALIDLYVAQTNQAYANSGAFHRIRLVLREEVDYIESGEILIDLERLEDDLDSHIDHVHSLRETYSADLVHLLSAWTWEYTFAGIAYFEGSFGITRAAPWGGLVFAHELGHNMGLLHDRYVSLQESEETSLEGWHYGYVNQRAFEPGAPESTRWRTIMSYDRQCVNILGEEAYCPRLAYFSNPRLTYNGDPVGVSADDPSTGVDGPADAVRTLNERRGITANFRRSASSTPRVGLALSSYWLSENGGTSTVTATLHRPSSEDTKVTISASSHDAATLSKNRTLTIPAGRTRSHGAVTVTAVDNDDRTGSVEVILSATANNASDEGVIAPQSLSLYVIDDEEDTAPAFEAANVAYAFIAGEEDNRTLPQAIGGNGPLTYSLSPEPGNGVAFVSGPPPRIEVSTASVAAEETIYTLKVTDSDGDTDSLAVSITVRSAECAGSTAVSGYTGNGIVDDCEALLASRDILRGEQSLNWSVNLPIAQWEGIELHSDRVYGIEFREAEVSGRLPSTLGELTHLSFLILIRNQLHGTIPPELGKLGNLQYLWLSSNSLSGHIPQELGNLNNLKSLWLGSNSLSGPIPSELGSLANLGFLGLSYNQLSGSMPPDLGKLTDLSSLLLYSNQLRGPIPPELGKLDSLEDLWLGSNSLSGSIPPELGNLTNLKDLLLNHNELSGTIPTELGNLTNLERVHMRTNRLIGCVPEGLLDVPDNDLEELGTPSCKALLSGLTVSPGALVPPFDPAHTSYTAVVGQSRVTIIPTGDAGATVQIHDKDGSAIPDADASVAGHQIDLDSVVTVITLRVIPEDGRGAQHYTININHANAPGAPVIESISPGGQALTVVWTAPEETGGTDIASYDIRYIESDSADKSDGNWTVATEVWTGGARRYTLTGLEADVSYDVQMRAVHGAGSGTWSETVTGTPTAVSDTCLEVVTESTTVYGTWDSECESSVRIGSYARFYSFTLAEPGDVAVTLESEVDTYLYIREGEGIDGHIVHEDDDDDHSDFTLNSSTDSGILESLDSGTYTIEATTYDAGQPAAFTLGVELGTRADAECSEYSESPDLAEKVASGELSSVCERLPSEPLTIPTIEDTGEYGGILRRFYLGPADGCNFFRLSRASLVRFSQDGFSLVPSVAKDWKMSEDGKEWTFYLREGMKWSDGDNFNADDFLWNYENVLLNEDLTQDIPVFLRIGNEVGSIEKVNDTTVKFVFPQPNFLFLEIVAQADEACYGASRNVPWAPSHYMQQFHIDYNSDVGQEAQAAGFGDWVEYYNYRTQYNLNPEKPSLAPWRFTNKLGDQVVMTERNPYFWAVDEVGNQLPYVDGIQLTLVESIESGVLRAAQGEIDMQGRHIQIDQFNPLKDAESEGGYKLLTWPAFGGSDAAFFFNMSMPGPTGDAIRTKEFRQALSLAIDRSAIQEIQFLGFGEIRQSVPSPGHAHYPGDDIANLRTAYDMEEANRLLDSVFPDKDSEGWRLSSGERIVMSITATDSFRVWPDTAQLVGRAWEEVGVKTDVNVTTRTQHFTRWQTNEWAVMVWNEDTTGFTFSSVGKRAPAGIGSFHGPGCAQWLVNPEAEYAFPCAQESLDLLEMHGRGPGLQETERNALGREIYKFIVENQYNIGIVGLSPMVQGMIVKKNELRNVPDIAANDWPLRTPNTGFPEQWYFAPEIEPVVAVPGALSAGPSHACSLNQNGEISCQGVDDSAQVSGSPTAGGFTVISVGARHSCAIDEEGAIQCWGSDEHGQVSGRPESGEFIAVGTGTSHTCAIDISGSVHCWGSGEYGQTSPPFEGEFVAIGAGDRYTCGLRSDGTLECWGDFDSVDSSSP
ncbi:MAG: hypothetical protein F4X57_13810 [Chloroflexi bacterium]|nr:hypothetical protein [Chloroflexota bacterium]